MLSCLISEITCSQKSSHLFHPAAGFLLIYFIRYIFLDPLPPWWRPSILICVFPIVVEPPLYKIWTCIEMRLERQKFKNGNKNVGSDSEPPRETLAPMEENRKNIICFVTRV